LVLGSCLASSAVIYFTLTAHLTGDHLRFKNEYFEILFPKNWYGFSWEDRNATTGNLYTFLFGPTDMFVWANIVVYDEVATNNLMEENNLTDAFSVVIHGATTLYEQALQNNNNATFFFIENGTSMVSDHKAYYTEFAIRDGFTLDDAFYNMTCIFISYIDLQRLVHIAFQGEEEDWIQAYDTFETILDSIET
jgi:hypothetical protein